MSNSHYLARSLAFLAPILLLTFLLGLTSCGNSVFSADNSSTASPTATSTGSGGSFAYVTNVGSGFITEFKRNVTTGVLKYNTRIAAGSTSSKGGPLGIAITSNNSFLYAGNSDDGNIYQFTVGSDGTLTPMTPPSVANGASSFPVQVLTLSSDNVPTWLFVANNGEGTISAYPISAAGPLGTVVTSSAPAMSGPFGLAINSTGTILYVSDNARGTIYALGFNSTTGVLSNIAGSPVNSQGTFAGSPAFLALNPDGSSLVVGDTNPAVATISLFQIPAIGGVPTGYSPAVPTNNAAIGVVWDGSLVALSANQNTNATAAGSITSYILAGGSTLSPSVAVPSVNGPTNIVVDPQGAFAYSTDKGDGTINQYPLGVICQSGGSEQTICPASNVVASDPKISNPSPFGIVLTN